MLFYDLHCSWTRSVCSDESMNVLNVLNKQRQLPTTVTTSSPIVDEVSLHRPPRPRGAPTVVRGPNNVKKLPHRLTNSLSSSERSNLCHWTEALGTKTTFVPYVHTLTMSKSPSLFATLKRILTNLFLISLIGILFLDSCPTVGPLEFLQEAQDKLDWFVDKTCLWQGQWDLFAPTVDKLNVRLSANIIYNDNTTQVWNSPDWNAMSPLTKKRMFRQAEYFDDVRLNSNSAAWAPLANYLQRKYHNPCKTITKIQLTRHWMFVKGPPKNLGLFEPIQITLPPLEKWRTYNFFDMRYEN